MMNYIWKHDNYLVFNILCVSKKLTLAIKLNKSLKRLRVNCNELGTCKALNACMSKVSVSLVLQYFLLSAFGSWLITCVCFYLLRPSRDERDMPTGSTIPKLITTLTPYISFSLKRIIQCACMVNTWRRRIEICNSCISRCFLTLFFIWRGEKSSFELVNNEWSIEEISERE